MADTNPIPILSYPCRKDVCRKDVVVLQVLVIDFVPLANEFIPLAIEFVALAFEFITLAQKLVHNKIGVNKKTRCSSCVLEQDYLVQVQLL